MKHFISTIVLFVLLLLGQAFAAVSQGLPVNSAPRIGVLHPGTATAEANRSNLELFRNSLRVLGYHDGRNIVIEVRSGRGKVDALQGLAAEFIRLKVALIVVVGPTAIEQAMKVSKAIPIVMVAAGNPVTRGFVKNVAVPGGNVTGLSSFVTGTDTKRLELLKEAFPSLSHVALIHPRRQTDASNVYQRAAQLMGMKLDVVEIRTATDLEPAFSRISAMGVDGLLTMRELLTLGHVEQIAKFALNRRLTSMFESEEFVRAGGLMSYGVNHRIQWSRAAVFVDKILKGAKPGLIPIEPPQIKFLVNLGTAKKLGLTIPPEILLEANEVIKEP
jgi:putative ABC transport system substrate-binding protein